MEIAILVTSSVSIIISFLALCVSIVNYIDNKALQKSTHTLQYVDPQQMLGTETDEQGFEKVTDKVKEKFQIEEDDLFGDDTVHTHMN